MSHPYHPRGKPLALIYLWISLTTLRCHAFIAIQTNQRTKLPSTLSATPTSEINRRELFECTTKTTGFIAATSFLQPANAITSTKLSSIPKSLCDPSVSTWTKSYEGNERTIHILGTAHISSASAELAGRLVREVKPNVVFVELDAKRVKRALPGLSAASNNALSDSKPSFDSSSGTNGDESNKINQTTNTKITVTSTQTTQNSMQSPIINLGSKYVGSAVKNMYGKLESEGFKAGDEFAMSVREGLSVGSTIVLGDRDVEVTLRRLTAALAKTDLRKLFAADNEIERSMAELLPDNMKASLVKRQDDGGISAMVKEQSGRKSSIIGSGNGASLDMGMDVQIDKAEFQTFVETMKAKENVKKIMAALQKTAPEIYEAMVAERDLYMGKGLDELGSTLQSDVTDSVAVMGMAHVDGVERYLASRGWEERRFACSGVTR